MLIQGPKKQVDEFESTTFHQLLHLVDTTAPPQPITPAIQKAQPNQDISPASTVTPTSIRENTISPSMLSANYPDRVPIHQPLRNDEETLDGLLKSVSKSPTSENVFRCHIKRLQIRADNIEGEVIKIDDKQKQFASSIQSIVAEGIEKGLSDLKKDITTHILSLLKAQHFDGKALSESIDTLTAEVRSNFSTSNLSYNDPRLEQANKQNDNLLIENSRLRKEIESKALLANENRQLRERIATLESGTQNWDSKVLIDILQKIEGNTTEIASRSLLTVASWSQSQLKETAKDR